MPRNSQEEQLYAPLDRNIIIAQHGLRKQTDDQMRNIAKIEDYRKRQIVDQAQINVIQTRMRSKEVNTGFRMQVPAGVPRGQRVYPNSLVREKINGQAEVASQTFYGSYIRASEAEKATKNAMKATKTTGRATERLGGAGSTGHDHEKRTHEVQLVPSLGPTKSGVESEDLGKPNKAVHSRHQRNMTLINGPGH